MPYAPNGFKVTFVIPKKYKGGNPIEGSKRARFGTELRELQTKFTKVPAAGEWQGQQDESVVYVISVRTVDEVDALFGLVKRWRAQFDQDAMYFDCQPVFFKEIDD